MEHVIRNIGLAKVRHHSAKLAFVPAFRDAGSDVESISRDSEQVLALSDIWRDVMLKVACVGSLESSCCNSGIPYQWCSVMIGTSGVVVI